MLTENSGRGIWIKKYHLYSMVIYWGNAIFFAFGYNIWEQYWVKNSWEGKVATHNQKESMYTMTLIFLSICRFYVYCFLYMLMQSVLFIYINLLSRRFVIFICNILIVFHQYQLDPPTAEVFFQIKLKDVIFFIGECRNQYDISVLIDTHSTNNVENQWHTEWMVRCIFVI